MDKHFTCVVCPIGCSLKVSQSEEGNLAVSGNRCKRGIEYGVNESTDPRRVVTSTVHVVGGLEPVTSVKTDGPIPKGQMLELMDLLQTIRVEAPCAEGTILIANVFGQPQNVVITRQVSKA
jgi:CxxC motif-containing protein